MSLTQFGPTLARPHCVCHAHHRHFRASELPIVSLMDQRRDPVVRTPPVPSRSVAAVREVCEHRAFVAVRYNDNSSLYVT